MSSTSTIIVLSTSWVKYDRRLSSVRGDGLIQPDETLCVLVFFLAVCSAVFLLSLTMDA